MYCKICGRDIGTKEKCPFCDAERHNVDPFIALRDIEPIKSNGSMEGYANTPIIPSTIHDCFSVLGDLEPRGDCFVEAYYANTNHEINYINPFHSMGNLDSSYTSSDDSGMDAPATGGFKPMDELISPNNGQENTEETGKRNPTVTFVWKKWMTIAACCTTIICLLLCVVYSPALRFANGEFSAESAENVLEQVLEAPILEVDTEGIETPSFLYSIESRNGYEILSFKKTQTGAVATMRVFAPDVYGVAKNLDSSNTYADANTLMDTLDNSLKTAPIVEKQVVVEYILTGQGYAPILTAEFLDAYYGGIYHLRDEAIANAAVEG